MSDPVNDLLERFRADAPEPDDAQRARAYRHATSPRRSRRPLTLSAVAAAVVVAAVAFVLDGRGPAAPDEAQAATIVRRAIAATEQPASGILHVRYTVDGVPWAGAGRVAHITVEAWRELGSRRYRVVSDGIVAGRTIEVASDGGDPSHLQIFDPRAGAIYTLPPRSGVLSLGPSSSFNAFSDLAATLRSALEGGTLADVWQVGRTTLGGRDVYRISNAQSSGSGPTGTTYFVDAETYVPVRVEEPGMPKDQRGGPYAKRPTTWSVNARTPASLTATTISVYETLPLDDANRLLDEQAAHPDAKLLPAPELPADLAARVGTVLPSSSSRPTANVTRLSVDPERGSIGSFRIGDTLLDLSKVVPPPLDQLPVLPGNLHDAAVAGKADAAGVLAVTFRDSTQKHSTSAYLDRPFQTPRGDRSGPIGTTLAQFLGRWPEHGAPTEGARGTTSVTVAKATFFFSSDDRLVAVQIGEGDAATYASR
jgi:hypothetical protein